MTGIASRVRLLRWLFVGYLFAVVGIDVCFSLGASGGHSPGLERLGLTPGVLVTISLVTYAVVFGAVWLLFHFVQRQKRWARIALIVIGWLVVVDAISSFLFTVELAGLGRWLGQAAAGLDLDGLLMLDRAKDFLGLLYFGFAIYVLQFDPKFKKEFESR